jgi:outer membrane protein TolC
MRRLMSFVIASAVLAVCGLAGCTTFSPDGGMGAVREITGSGLHQEAVALRGSEDEAAAGTTIRRLLKTPLTADAAVRIALLNNRDLQAAYNELRIAEAVSIAASLPPSPVIAVSSIAGDGAFEIERQIAVDILALASLPERSAIARDRFRQAQLRAALATLRLAAATRRAYYRAAAAGALARFLGEAQANAEEAARLSHRLGESGALNRLDQARDQVFYAELTAQLASARRRAASEREALVRQLGLWGDDLGFRLPAALPARPAKPQMRSMVETEAIHRRVDLQIARIEVEALAKSYGLTAATRFIDLLEVAGVAKTAREPGTERFTQRGVSAEVQVPLFDFGEVRLREAEETYMQAVNRLTAKAVNVRSQARDAYQAYRSAYDIARQYDREVLPLRRIISEENMLRYNAMQIDVFALLAEARQRIASTVAAIAAERDFWLADVDLGAAVFGGAIGEPAATDAMAAAGPQ